MKPRLLAMLKPVAVAFLIAAAATPARAANELGDLAWIAGRWHSERDGEAMEESWGVPVGDSMTGVFRLVKNGVARFYEFMTIEQTSDGATLRILHFGPKLVGWEDKGKALAFRLTAHRDGEAVFDVVGDDAVKQLIYRRQPDGGLLIRLVPRPGSKHPAEDFLLHH